MKLFTANTHFKEFRLEITDFDPTKDEFDSLQASGILIPLEEEHTFGQEGKGRDNLKSFKYGLKNPSNIPNKEASDNCVKNVTTHCIASINEILPEKENQSFEELREKLSAIDSLQDCLDLFYQFMEEGRIKESIFVLHRWIDLNPNKSKGFYEAALILKNVGLYVWF